MIYNETLVIQNNKAKRILELCKSLGIELFDSYNKSEKIRSKSSTVIINDYLVEYFQWSGLVKDHLNKMFLTPRLQIEFDKKDVFGTTFKLNIQAHIDNVLAQQIYFVEIIISEIMKYKFVDSKASAEQPNLLQKIFASPTKRKLN